MLSDTNLFQIVVVIVQALIALAGFIGAFMINRLIKQMDLLGREDSRILAMVLEHREDVLRNYIREETMTRMKEEIIGRMNRMESNLLATLSTHQRP